MEPDKQKIDNSTEEFVIQVPHNNTSSLVPLEDSASNVVIEPKTTTNENFNSKKNVISTTPLNSSPDLQQVKPKNNISEINNEFESDPNKNKYFFNTDENEPDNNPKPIRHDILHENTIHQAQPIAQTSTINKAIYIDMAAQKDMQENAVKNSKLKLIYIISGVLVVFIIGVVGFLILNKPIKYTTFKLSNDSIDYSFQYYPDAKVNKNLLFNKNELVGNAKNLYSVVLAPTTHFKDCTQLYYKINVIGIIQYKNIKYNLCGDNTHEIAVFQNNNSFNIFQILSVNKSTITNQDIVNVIFNSLQITNQ